VNIDKVLTAGLLIIGIVVGVPNIIDVFTSDLAAGAAGVCCLAVGLERVVSKF